jgi:hypothetical protein
MVALVKYISCLGKTNLIYEFYKFFTVQSNSCCALLDIVDPWEFYCDPINIIKLDLKPT